jgi:hypothetical protein
MTSNILHPGRWHRWHPVIKSQTRRQVISNNSYTGFEYAAKDEHRAVAVGMMNTRQCAVKEPREDKVFRLLCGQANAHASAHLSDVLLDSHYTSILGLFLVDNPRRRAITQTHLAGLQQHQICLSYFIKSRRQHRHSFSRQHTKRGSSGHKPKAT